MRHAPMTLAITLCLLAAPAAAFRPHIPLDIGTTNSPQTYEVFEQRGAGPTHMWCAAADHANRFLGAPSAQRIYVARPLGASDLEPHRTSVRFSLSPPQAGLDTGQGTGAAAPNPVLAHASIRQAGASMNLTQALQYCTDHLETP